MIDIGWGSLPSIMEAMRQHAVAAVACQSCPTPKIGNRRLIIPSQREWPHGLFIDRATKRCHLWYILSESCRTENENRWIVNRTDYNCNWRNSAALPFSESIPFTRMNVNVKMKKKKKQQKKRERKKPSDQPIILKKNRCNVFWSSSTCYEIAFLCCVRHTLHHIRNQPACLVSVHWTMRIMDAMRCSLAMESTAWIVNAVMRWLAEFCRNLEFMVWSGRTWDSTWALLKGKYEANPLKVNWIMASIDCCEDPPLRR